MGLAQPAQAFGWSKCCYLQLKHPSEMSRKQQQCGAGVPFWDSEETGRYFQLLNREVRCWIEHSEWRSQSYRFISEKHLI